jgi:predicted dehydrogenase
MGSTRRISLGLVGLGSFGSSFAGLFKSHPLVDRFAICDLDPHRVARLLEKDALRDKLNPRDAFTSLDDLLASDIECIALFTQHWLHAAQAVKAMERGKHVYSAVPLITLPSGDEMLEWCDRIVDTCRRTGQSYMLGETTYFHADAMYCRRRAAEGAFGEFVYAEGEYLHSFDSPACDLRQVRAHRLASPAGEEWKAIQEQYRARGGTGSPMHYPTHSTSGPISVMKAHALKVTAWGTPARSDDPYFTQEMMPFSNITALYKMSNGATLRICEHRDCAIIREDFRVHGTQAAYEHGVWYDKEKPTRLTTQEMRDPLPPEVLDAFTKQAKAEGRRTDDGVYGGHGGSHAYLVHEFVDAIAHNRRPAIHAWEAVRYMAPGILAHRSALRDGETLTVPDWGDPPG